jgi:hypothetical protein
MCAGAAAQKYMQKLAEEQEILISLSDMVIKIYEMESAILRAEKYVSIHGEEAGKMRADLAKVHLYDSMDLINKAGKDAINAFSEGDMQRMMLLGLKRFTKTQPFNSIEARRRIADYLIKSNEFKLD